MEQNNKEDCVKTDVWQQTLHYEKLYKELPARHITQNKVRGHSQKNKLTWTEVHR